MAGTPIERVYTESPQTVLAYWTDEKLRAVRDKGDAPIKPPGTDPFNSDGDAWEGTGPFPAGVGRLLFVAPNGKDSSCTATAIDSPAGNVLVTAFHCLEGPDEGHISGWSSKLLFLPGFHDGATPLGRYPIHRMVASDDVLDIWRDTAFLQAHPGADGRSVAEAAGEQAIRFDIPESASPRINFGYPASSNGYGIIPPPGPREFGNREYSGQRLAYCATQRTALSQCEGVGNGPPVGWGFHCVQGPGSSGGPSLIDFNFDTGKGVIVGVHSNGVIMDGRAAACAAHLEEHAAKAYQYVTE
ncbi:peptidase [Stenotrophomonas tumulicola]